MQKTPVILACIFFLFFSCWWLAQNNEHGVREPQEIGVRYLNALESGDKARIESLIHPNSDYADELDKKLAQYNQINSESLTVVVIEDEIGVGGEVLLTDIDGNTHDRLLYLRHGPQWYIVIGQLNGPGRGEPTTSITPQAQN